MYCADVLLVQAYLPYALGLFFFCKLLYVVCVSIAVFNWHIDSDTLSIGFFFSVLCVTDGCELSKSPVFMVSF